LNNKQILNNLHKLKACGIEYIDPLEQEVDGSVVDELPNDMLSLEKMVSKCHLCELSKLRKNVVFGEGNLKAKLMFIGEAPSQSEDELGRVFVGRAGELLTKIIENVFYLKRSDVYIANILKCRPPNNRIPTQHEAQTCKGYLLKQIELINPKMIITLGETSYKHLTNDQTPISKIRGHLTKFNNTKLMPTFHPSYLLRNPSAKKMVFEDMLVVKEQLVG
jgi:DNA polymerase